MTEWKCKAPTHSKKSKALAHEKHNVNNAQSCKGLDRAFACIGACTVPWESKSKGDNIVKTYGGGDRSSEREKPIQHGGMVDPPGGEFNLKFCEYEPHIGKGVRRQE